MEKSQVALVVCRTYEQEQVDSALEKGIRLLGGIEAIFSKEEKILLKPNLLAKAAPEKAVTTHPAVFKAVGKLLQEAGYENLYYGDSPGNPIGGVARVASGCGIKEVADELKIELGDFNSGQEIVYEEGLTEKHFIISNAILDCDGIVNICKMKTHQLERITGATKNMFGAVYGLNKGAFHAKYTDADSFAKMIADLNNFVRPRLNIMDGIIAMEGNGPQSGTPIAMNMMLLSKDPIALDTVFCGLVGLNPELVPTNKRGQEYGVGTMLEEEIDVLTDEGILTIDDVSKKYGNFNFDVYRGGDSKMQLKMLKPMQPLLEKKPVIIKEKCVKCGICVDSCPLTEKAISLQGYPAYNYKTCIRCYCCQEMCPQKAIEVKTPRLARMFDRNWKI
ncbi:DUF362 domain-containing protein [Clostridium aminobutyricum]|uniref:Ferredoxin n=1 Tax=Clostridium aminobutyricum TaxID=33953 RepID=A0A939D8E0_CLOAM|nr:DUF362 domain-containing protein [Clostridium aminobutyricum]MBN7773314.1 DUF362 domain-containing protein [Clostridium aminobutyricum]